MCAHAGHLQCHPCKPEAENAQELLESADEKLKHGLEMKKFLEAVLERDQAAERVTDRLATAQEKVNQVCARG